jgi:4-amino-4-deoxy-L-arabinose transferase-like glycosyltransferase
MGGSDRALLLGLPALAVLAAFALPTLQRSTASAIDWFSVFFFSICALAIWVVYSAMQTGVPAQPAANVVRLAPGFTSRFSTVALLFAVAGTLAWLWLVRWRSGRNRHPLWKSMVLPASGVALCWLLLMTLWLPLLDHARSYRPLVQRIALVVPRGACVAAPGVPRAQLAALEYLGRFKVDATASADSTDCGFLMQMETRRKPGDAGPLWVRVATERRPTDREELTAIYRRVDSPR